MIAIRKVVSYIILFLIGAIIILFVTTYHDKLVKIFFPIVLAGVLTYILRPMVLKLEKRNISRTQGILLIYLFSGIVLIASVIFIMPVLVNNTREFINTFPQITLEYKNNFNNAVKMIDTSNWPIEIKNAVFNEINNAVGILEIRLLNTLRNALFGSMNAATSIGDFIIAMIIAYYLIKDAEFFKKNFLSLVPRKWRNNIIVTCREINDILSSFIQGQILTAVIIGIMETTALLVIGVKYAPILGIIGGISNIIPYFGPFIGAIPAVAVAFIDSPVKVVWTITAFIVIQLIDNAFISPKIIEGRLGLHPVTTILAVLVGEEFFGIAGMLVAVPVTAVIKVILKRSIETIV
ncbi:MAG: AI-2E family transporter [Clostridium sp.]|jgi:predicted PurR-regulated permease PerM|nr:AI-2E family transporter [Clostridium sp.]